LTSTMSVGPGFVLPVPACCTLNARPDLVFLASFGAAATSAGAGGVDKILMSSTSKTSMPAGAPGREGVTP